MEKIKKSTKFNFSKINKKNEMNTYRFVFNAKESISGYEQSFFIELAFVNPLLSPNEVILGFTPCTKLSDEDLQYRLTNGYSEQNNKIEKTEKPSFCVIRIGKLGEKPKHICGYFSYNEITFNKHPFELQIGNKTFSLSSLTGFLNISNDDINQHPEYLCNSGYATWNINYKIIQSSKRKYGDSNFKWQPLGYVVNFDGKINFEGTDYFIDHRKTGFIEHIKAKLLPEPYFYMSASNLTSLITGQDLNKSSFVAQGIFTDRVSFLCKINDIEIHFSSNSSRRKYKTIWDCSQVCDTENNENDKLHWSLSLSNSKWIIDIDVFCNTKELCNRKLKTPKGERQILNLLEGIGEGEIKIYQKNGKTIEQLEHARLTKSLCQYGVLENSEF